MRDLGAPELLIILFIVILIVCAPRLPRGPFSN
jgi:Sec-independent protein translocase protein TatA